MAIQIFRDSLNNKRINYAINLKLEDIKLNYMHYGKRVQQNKLLQLKLYDRLLEQILRRLVTVLKKPEDIVI